MSGAERRATTALAGIFALRMLGLFMVLPVFTLYAEGYTGYTPALAGLAIGIYGLTQAVFQIPFGMISDRIGRKRVIVAGLVIFAAGSVVAAVSTSLWGVILGRALQGAGAIAAAVMALAADLTREEQRTKGMAIIGSSIGLAFAVALVAGPAVARSVGLAGVFWATGALALIGVVLLVVFVPSPTQSRFHRDAEAIPAQFLSVLRDGQLLRLDAGILILHCVLMATWVALPLALRDGGGLEPGSHWQIYLLVLALSVLLMAPVIILGARFRVVKPVFVGAVALLGLAQAGLVVFHGSLTEIVVLMVLYFTAFNILEAHLPALVSRFAPAEKKGTALGVYSTSQFLGAFLGGAIGGWLYGELGAEAVFGFGVGLASVWLVLAVTMGSPGVLTNRLLRLGAISEEQAPRVAEALGAIPGVAEAVVIVEDGIAYLKVDRRALDERALRAFCAARA